MPQHDMNLTNDSGANLRADLNLALAALVQNSSGATEPSTMFAHQFWADTSPAGYTIFKVRDAANAAWATCFDDEGRWKGIDGSASEPSISFGSDVDTGFYRPGSNSVALSLGGTQVFDFDPTSFIMTGSGEIALWLVDSTAASNEGVWTMESDAGVFELRAWNDVHSSGGLAFRITRTANVVDKLDIVAKEFHLQGSVTHLIQNKGTDTTPSVLGIATINITGWTAGNDITDFDDAVAGQEILVVGNDSDCNIVNGVPIQLVGGTTWNAAAGAFIKLWSNGTTWFEMWRSDAS